MNISFLNTKHTLTFKPYIKNSNDTGGIRF